MKTIELKTLLLEHIYFLYSLDNFTKSTWYKKVRMEVEFSS